MIKNERQYRITKAQAQRFSQALDSLRDRLGEAQGIHPLLVKAQEDALSSQLVDLQSELREYESLKAGEFRIDELKTVAELPIVLIKARIAQGLTQKDLADRIGLKEQQIQRYEATDYASASLARIKVVVSALGVEIGDPAPMDHGASLGDIVRKVAVAGLEPEFIVKRLVPRRLALTASLQDAPEEQATLLHQTATTIERVFGWSAANLLSAGTPQLESTSSGVRFKVAATAVPRRVSAYTVYAHYLSLLVADACSHLPTAEIPTDPLALRSDVISSYGSLSLEAIVRYTWDLGVPVLGLDDPGAFHGACFREGGRNVIVLKQKTSSESRWAFDLLHEVWHVAQEPDMPERSVLESDELSDERRESEEERTAGLFAGAVLLGGKGQQLAEKCLKDARQDLRLLKKAVQDVAGSEGAPVDILANYLAFRLTAQGENWWGTATSLQSKGNPWAVVREVFFENTDFSRLSESDREILAQAVAPWEEVANV